MRDWFFGDCSQGAGVAAETTWRQERLLTRPKEVARISKMHVVKVVERRVAEAVLAVEDNPSGRGLALAFA